MSYKSHNSKGDPIRLTTSSSNNHSDTMIMISSDRDRLISIDDDIDNSYIVENTKRSDVGKSHDKATLQNLKHQKKLSSQFVLGLFFIGIVVVIWVLDSILVQHIYIEYHFRAPFFLTYFSNSLFILYLPLPYVKRAIQKVLCKYSLMQDNNTIYDDTDVTDETDETVNLMEQYEIDAIIIRNNSTIINDNAITTDATPASTAAITTTTNVSASNITGISNMSAMTTEVNTDYINRRTSSINIDSTTSSSSSSSNSSSKPYTLKKVILISVMVAPLWFLANYTYNVSLGLTSVSSNTILSSTSSVFTFLLSACFIRETITSTKIIGLLITILGAFLVGYADDAPSEGETMTGDIVCLLSASMYGVYTTLIKFKVPSDDHVDMSILFGYMGLFNTVLLFPVVVYQHYTGLESLSVLTTKIVFTLFIKGIFDNVLCDYLWARAMLLTSPTIATLSLSLTIPFAMAADSIMGKQDVIFMEGIGAMCVLAGFLCVTISSKPATTPAV